MALLPVPEELEDEDEELEEELLEDELLELLEELEEELLDELEVELPEQTTPPLPYWLLQVVSPIQLWLFSQPQPLLWLAHRG